VATFATAQPTDRLTDDQLIERVRTLDDREALDVLVERYRPLAIALARRYSYTSEAPDDLEQVACMGLVAAISRYDPERASSLRSFAVPTILGELRRHFRDAGWAVHVPRALQERSRAVREAVNLLAGRLMRSPTPAEVAKHLDLSVEQVLESLEVRRAYSPDSLDSPAPSENGDSDRTLEAVHGCEEVGYARVEASATVERALNALPRREQHIIRLRFGADLSQAEIGQALGISQMHVSRLLRRGISRVATIVHGPAGGPVA
jgi:RNA polymerase sigma-B factor